MEGIGNYITQLPQSYPKISSIWLFGSRANNSFNDSSDWDLLVFADEDTLKALRLDERFVDDRIDLFIVFNSNDAEKPYVDMRDGERTVKTLNLTNLEWNQVEPRIARYRHEKFKNDDEWFKSGNFETRILNAYRIWPE